MSSNQLFAKLKGVANNHRLVVDDESILKKMYESPSLETSEEYAPLDTSKDRQSWQHVTLEVDQIESMVEQYIHASTSPLPQIEQADYASVDTLYAVMGNYIFFSRIGNPLKIHENGRTHLLFGQQEPRIEQMSFAIEFDGSIDAVYETNTKRIHFQSFAKAKPLFKGFDVFHQELTLEEKEMFLVSDIFDVGDFNLNAVSLSDTLKIAAIRERDEFNLDDPDVKSKIVEYVHEYPSVGLGINDEGKVMVKSRKDVSNVIKLLEQRFYTSPLTGEKYIASTFKKLAK